MPGAWNRRIPVALGNGPQKQLPTPSLKTLKRSVGHCAQACHLRVIYNKPSKRFDASAFLLIQIINEKIDFLDRIPSSLMETDDLTEGILPFIRAFLHCLSLNKARTAKEDWGGILKPVCSKIHSVRHSNVSGSPA